MALFRTDVQSSVQESLTSGKPLFVYLSDETDVSAKFVSVLSSDITDVISSQFIAVALVKDTLDYNFFKQIFPDIQSPSFYIVKKGQILDIITPNDLIEVVQEKIANSSGNTTNSLQSIAGSASLPATSSTSLSSNTALDLRNSDVTSRDLNNQHLDAHAARDLSNFENSSIQSEGSSNAASGTSKTNKIKNKSTVSKSDNERLEIDNSREESIKKHQAEVKLAKQKQQKEKDRLRSLIEADKKERSLNKKSNKIVEPVPKSSQLTSSKFDKCSLAIKLFDGSTLVKDFASDQNLNDVRSWLDVETDIIPDTSSLPSFASNTGPNHYVFHRPTIPRATFTDEQEFIKLSDLDLCPRSALILKPIYMEIASAYPTEKNGILKSIYGGLSSFTNALQMFFDYGVDQTNQSNPSSSDSLTDESREGRREAGSGANTPNLFSIRDSNVMSSLINIENSRNPTQASPPSESPLISRAGTPLGRHHTVHTLDDDEDKLNTYNGNSVNLNPKKKDEKTE